MSDKLSQDDIDNLLKGKKDGSTSDKPDFSSLLTNDDKDIIGEIGNIFMGSASTTLSQLLNNKVDINAPTVDIFENINESFVIAEDHLVVEILYTEGLQGTIVLALKKNDSAIIADLMMGGSGKIDTPEIGEIQISAVGEAMNQMVGSASTTLSGMFSTPINISPPEIKLLKKDNPMELKEDLRVNPIVTIKFNMKIGDLINSDIIQFMCLDSAKSQVDQFTKMMKSMSQDLSKNLQSGSMVESLSVEAHSVPIQAPPPPPPAVSIPQQQMQQPPPGYYAQQPQPQIQPHVNPVTVQPVQFSTFDQTSNILGDANKNLNLVMDVKLELTVELGRTDLPIKSVLELTRGSIIELDKVAGEPVELYANGKLIAKGEVVVIEDNFGLRITTIISPEKRIQEL